MASSETGPVKDPLDDYDRAHGTPDNGPPKLSDDEAWGTKLNPVRETLPAFTGLKKL